jgi:hypothetical protein
MNIITGKIPKAQRTCIYGQEGVGKTTLAAQFPKPLFIDTEDGSGHLDVARTPRPTSWAMLLAQIAEIARDSHGFQTLVIDTADWAERLCQNEVCAAKGKTGIEDFGYGKGYVYVAEAYSKLLDALTGLRDAGMHVVLVAHGVTRKFELPEEEGSFDRYEMKLSRHVSALVREWADVILFCRYRTIVVVDENGKGKAQGAKRVIQTTHHATWDAKNRLGMPDELPMEWAAFERYFPSAAQSVTPPSIQSSAPASIQPPTPSIQPAASAAHQKLADLMVASGVTAEQLQAIIEAHSRLGTIHPKGTPVANWSESFINKAIIPSWDKIVKTIKEQSA